MTEYTHWETRFDRKTGRQKRFDWYVMEPARTIWPQPMPTPKGKDFWGVRSQRMLSGAYYRSRAMRLLTRIGR
jgi:hypothetical protein